MFVSKNKMQLKCPMCPSKVVHLRHHLRSQHKIKNPEERQIMLRLARGRVRLHDIKCPVCSINYINIKRHIRLGHWELTPKQVKTFIKELHLKVSIDQLKKLCLVVSAGWRRSWKSGGTPPAAASRESGGTHPAFRGFFRVVGRNGKPV